MHTLQCYSNPHADVETAADWEATLPDEYSGIWADDLIAVANSQIGYFESIDNYQVIENTKEYNGYTRYGAWNEEPYADWSMDFTAFCLHYASVDPELFPVDTEGIDQRVKALLKAENISERADETEYAPGDIILFTPTKEKGSSTIAAFFALPENPDPEVTSGQAADESSNDSLNEPGSGGADDALADDVEDTDADGSVETFANTNNFDKFDDSILVEEVIKEGKGNRRRRRG